MKPKNKKENTFSGTDESHNSRNATKRKRKSLSELDSSLQNTKLTWDMDPKRKSQIYEDCGINELEEDSRDAFPEPTPKILMAISSNPPGAPKATARYTESDDSNEAPHLHPWIKNPTPHRPLNEENENPLKKRRKVCEDRGRNELFVKLSDEIILNIFTWLPKCMLVKCARVCKRWKGLCFDESLWKRLDMASKVLKPGVLGRILNRGVRVLRLAKAEVNSPLFINKPVDFPDLGLTRVQYLDLSMTVVSEAGLEELLGRCKSLRKLSLEHCALNDKICGYISENKLLEVLNLSMCQGITKDGLKAIGRQCQRLEALNIAWIQPSKEVVDTVVTSLTRGLLKLNFSGCRELLSDENVLQLVTTCPHLRELDLSDSTFLSPAAVECVADNLRGLEYVAFSRCYQIPPNTFVCLNHLVTLLALDVFGMMKESSLENLRESMSQIEINKYHFSSIARPTTGIRRTSVWGLRVRDQVVA
ncbi:S-phase kinase-associated protein 2 isoform X2 [Lingula anatina]|uniref:S-phase kinase-associated protein 2 n=1 Tax=Lingula anatina TaxID=7574 RepID=A0A1S3J9H8_LINAN|nr:S-phase kinase-associated protein 2 isoform X2 [Lingula anatina]|eukprot:XP_013406968.1 S-phase kinase-associated protein 2 isoform X2 [Lingula anatina]